MALVAAACAPRVYSVTPVTDGELQGRYRDHANDESIVFAVMGDFGRGNYGQYAVADAMHTVCQKRVCDFVLGLGDNIYPNGVRSVHDPQLENKFEKPYAEFGRFDFWMILGNHDWRGNAQAQIDYTRHSPRWRLPSAYYAVPGLPPWLSLFGIDSTAVGQNQPIEREQRERAKAHLCRRDGWRILFAHHPGRSSAFGGNSPRMQQYLEPIFETCRIHVVLAGHDHHQELTEADGTVHVVQGAGSLPGALKADASTEFTTRELGFSIVEARPEALSIDFYDTSGARLYGGAVRP